MVLGKQTGEGFEYHLLVMAMSIALLLNGEASGRISGRQIAAVPKRGRIGPHMKWSHAYESRQP